MRILIIAIKEIKENLRDKVSMVLMVLLPIVLTTILGLALSDTGGAMEDIKALYTDHGDSTISVAFDNFVSMSGKNGVKFTETEDPEEALKSASNGKYDGYVILNGSNLTLYKRNSLSAAILQNILKTFTDRYNVVTIIAKRDPFAVSRLSVSSGGGFVDVVSLNEEKQPSSLDYYSVTMLTLIILYGALFGIYAVGGERTRKTGSRILCGPTRRYEILTGKLLGNFVSLFVQSTIVFLFSRFVLGADWGSDIPTVAMIIISEIFFSISTGICIGLMFDNYVTANSITNWFIPFIAFLGGAYIPISNIGSEMLNRLSVISPLRWTNSSILQVIFAGDYGDVPVAIAINIGFTVVSIILSSYMFQREWF